MTRKQTKDIIQTHSQTNVEYEIRRGLHQNRKHIIVPVVMMVEGVHSGSRGAVLHKAEELGKITESWNGIPVMINHPENEGTNISANSPTVIDSQSVGRIYNSHMDGNSLKAEAWLDEEKLTALSPAALAYILGNHPLDVSVGVFTEDENTEGDYNNEHYEAIATNYRPDHLALLPGGVGACSWNDGCGIRVNNKKEGGENVVLTDEVIKKIKEITPLMSNQQGMMEIMDMLRRKVDGLDNADKYHILHDVFKSYLIFETRPKDGSGVVSALYKQNYQVNDNEVVFTGEPIAVKRKVEYVVFSRIINNQNIGDHNMDDKKPCGGCMEKIVALINNAQTNFTADDREWLLTQDEATLDKLFPKEPEKIEPVQINKEQALGVLKESIKKPEDFINLLPDEMKDSMQSGLALHQEMRQKMIQSVMDNAKDVWTKDELEKMNTDTLKKVANSITVPADYSLKNSIIKNNAEDMEVLILPGIEIKK